MMALARAAGSRLPILSFYHFIRRIYACRAIIVAMAKADIKARYAETLGGTLWTMLNPVIVILTYWVVFDLGFKVAPTNGKPFIASFVCAMTAWTTFAEILNTSVNSVTASAYLVRKIAFPTEVLPVVKIAGSLATHAYLLIMIVVVILYHGLPLSFFYLQFIYYLAALIVFSLGLCWLLAALNVFYRNVAQIVTAILGVWFWLTPIVWLPEMVPPQYRPYLLINPMYYIVDGYRQSFLSFVPFWDDWRSAAVFWAIALSVCSLGAYVFRRLKTEFADVL